MRNPVRLALLPISLSFSIFTARGADVFHSAEEKRGFLEELEEMHQQYDPRENLIQRPFSSPGYHTTLKGGTVHPTCDSLNYSVALLDSGDPAHLKRACDVLRRAIGLQDQNPANPTYGIWSWFMEEPLEQMSPPDWNWADFCGTQLIQIALDHRDRRFKLSGRV